MVVCGALVASPDGGVFTPQDLAYRTVGLDYGNGTAYAGFLMLEGAMPREAVTTRAAHVSPAVRLDELLRGEIAATVLQEPWITIAEKAGCRLVSTSFFYGTWVAGPDLSVEAYAAFIRAITNAVKRINADKRRYLSYFIDAAKLGAAGFSNPALVAGLRPEDFDLDRIQAKEPGPVPVEQARWAWEWMAGWGFLQGSFDPAAQLNRDLESKAYALAGVAP
jgi:hypothetical protein